MSLRKLILFIWFLSLFSITFFAYKYISYKDEVYLSSKEEYRTLTVNMAKDIDKIAKNIVDTTNLIADGLTDGTIHLTDQDIVAALKAAVKNNTHLFGIAAAFKPFIYNQQKKLYAP
ncbi:MAG: hypothetical protein D3912_15825, partial [Candidatus Electrothrix sp. AX1]|nr:hypothetical protein [Candidatus Electrothrix sp. AX1]